MRKPGGKRFSYVLELDYWLVQPQNAELRIYLSISIKEDVLVTTLLEETLAHHNPALNCIYGRPY